MGPYHIAEFWQIEPEVAFCDLEGIMDIAEELLKYVIKDEYTILIIAHRLSTIVNCDRIMILEEGRTIDQGTHQELLERSNTYKNLYKTEMVKN